MGLLETFVFIFGAAIVVSVVLLTVLLVLAYRNSRAGKRGRAAVHGALALLPGSLLLMSAYVFVGDYWATTRPFDRRVVTISLDAAGAMRLGDEGGRVSWFCGFNKEVPDLCRGRADHALVNVSLPTGQLAELRPMSVTLYREAERLVGAQLRVAPTNSETLRAQLTAHAISREPIAWSAGPPTNAERACVKRSLVEAMVMAEMWISGTQMCSDIGSARVSWQFYRSDQKVRDAPSQVGFVLTIHSPSLPGPSSWWF